MKKPTDIVWDSFKLPFKALSVGGKFLIRDKVLNKKTGAALAKPRETKSYLNTRNKGLLLDGQRMKLSDKHSYMHLLVVGRSGAHKTTGFVLPNIYERAKLNSSMLINDPKGEIHELSSGFLRANGYEVHIVAPEDPDNSARINPLLECFNDIEREQLSETVIYADTTDQADFWPKAAIRFVSLFSKVLKNAEYDDPAYNTLSNIMAFLQNFGDDGSPLANVMGRYCTNPHNPLDATLFNEWLGLQQGNADGRTSAILTALTSMRWLNNPNLVKITSRSDFSFRDMKKKKMAVFISTPPQYSSYYGAFTSILFKCCYNALMRETPKHGDLPVYIYHDEFATSFIPDFKDVANTVRGYNVSISAIVQSVSQLKMRYGEEQAQSVMGGFSSYLTFSGSDLLTTDFFKDMVGTVRERQRKEFTDTTDTYREYNLLNSDEIRRLGDTQALFVTKNKNPVVLDYKPYFENPKYIRIAERNARLVQQYQRSMGAPVPDRIEFIPL